MESLPDNRYLNYLHTLYSWPPYGLLLLIIEQNISKSLSLVLWPFWQRQWALSAQVLQPLSKQLLRCKKYLYNISVRDISACSLTWPDYLHDLSTLQPIIFRDWIIHLNTRQLNSIYPQDGSSNVRIWWDLQCKTRYALRRLTSQHEIQYKDWSHVYMHKLEYMFISQIEATGWS
jgi:hypothetical protein